MANSTNTHDIEQPNCLICKGNLTPHTCTVCQGEGHDLEQVMLDCDECNGWGWVWSCPRSDDHGHRRQAKLTA